ncbi:hypothetical protein T492DRAFT_947132 [Pavlovales sp. CCMP2436]|nr:hypothetical protein T492DRAFT_947132 [Pavlovales sp. CCMP2436]
MSVNPALDEHTDDPVALEHERLLIRREGVTFDGTVDGTHYRLRGFAVLSNLRVVFVSQEPAAISALDLPLANTRHESFNQPIFGCSNISATTSPLRGGNIRSDVAWKLEFREGGVGTWLPWFFTVLKVMRRHVEAVAQGGGAPARAPAPPNADMMKQAYVDPHDPTKLYLPVEDDPPQHSHRD